MNSFSPPDLNAFPVGCMISAEDNEGQQRIITYTNRYMQQQLGSERSLNGQPLMAIFSEASKIIVDSYVLPMIMHEGQCAEVMLDLQQPEGSKIPVCVNARLHEKREIYWTFAVADKQKQLHSRLLETRDQLESKAKLLQQLSITDELTGLINRRELNRQATVLLAQSQRANWPLSLLMIDVDYFKKINDTMGHHVGDEVLIQLSRLLQKQARLSDIVCRFGGEEFVILMPDTHSVAAQIFAKRVHNAVSELNVAGLSLTVSIGISTTETSQPIAFKELVKQADEAMYQAKGQGRNASFVFNHQ